MKQTTLTLVALLGLLLVAAGLGLFAYFGVHEKDARESKQKAAEQALFPQPAAHNEKPAQPNFTRLTIRAKGDTTVLERGPKGEWEIVSPIRAAADKLTLDALVSQLQTAKIKDVIEQNADPAALERYGLAKPRFSVTAVTTQPGAQPVELVLHGGVENSFDGSIFVRRGDEPKVSSAPGGLRWALEKSTYELRDKQVLAVDEPKVSQLELKTSKRSLLLERTGKKSWRLVQPMAMTADTSTVEAMLASLRNERALAFPEDSPAARGTYGLETPRLEATVTLEGGEKIRLRFSLENADGPGKAYALREEAAGATLAEITPACAVALDKEPLDLRDRSVLAFDKEAVAKVRFRLADGSELVVERAGADGGSTESWQVLSPVAGKARAFKITAILWALGSLRAARFGEERPADWSRYGITSKSRAITLLDASGKELSRLTLGQKTETDTVYVRGNREIVIEADVSRLSELPSSVADLLEGAAADGG